MMKSKKVYICSTTWEHEIGETDVTVYPPTSLEPFKNHKGCGVVEATITVTKVVEKPKKGRVKTYSAKEANQMMIDSTKKEIKERKAFLKKLKKEAKELKKQKS